MLNTIHQVWQIHFLNMKKKNRMKPAKTLIHIHISIGDILNPNSYSWNDSSLVLGYTDPSALIGACYFGNFVYYPPYGSATFPDSRILRYDYTKTLGDASAWTMFNVQNISNLNARGFTQCICDGQFIYFVPYAQNYDLASAKTVRWVVWFMLCLFVFICVFFLIFF